MPDDSFGGEGQRSLQITVLVVIIVILSFLAIPQYLQLIDKTSRTKAEANLASLAQAQTAYYGLYGRYAATIEELAVETPGLEKMLGRNNSASQWDYSIKIINDNACDLVARSRKPDLFKAEKAVVIKRIGIESASNP